MIMTVKNKLYKYVYNVFHSEIDIMLLTLFGIIVKYYFTLVGHLNLAEIIISEAIASK